MEFWQAFRSMFHLTDLKGTHNGTVVLSYNRVIKINFHRRQGSFETDRITETTIT